MTDNGYIDEATLEEYTEEVEARELNAIGRSTVLFPSLAPGGRPWDEYLAEKGDWSKKEAAVPPTRSLVLCVDLTPSEDGLGSAPRKILKRLREAGWPRVELRSSIVAVSNSYYADDSTKKPGQEAPDHRKGDLKKPGHIARHWFLYADWPNYRLGLRAHWTEGVTPKGGRSFTFQTAHVADPLGMPAEFFYDYSPDANAKKRVKDEPGHIYEGRIALLEAAARRRDREYNDGAMWQNTQPMFKAFAALEAWLDEAIQMTTPREPQ